MKETIEKLRASGKKVLYLPIKQKYFDAILQGRKVQEFREVRHNNYAKYVQLDAEGFEVEDADGNAVPIKYDYIHFAVGYNKVRDEALVEVVSAKVQTVMTTINDKDGNPIKFEGTEEGFPTNYKVDEDGEFVLDENGNKIPDAEGLPMRVEKGGVSLAVPVFYEYGVDENGEPMEWMAEDVIYNLGKIIATKLKK